MITKLSFIGLTDIYGAKKKDIILIFWQLIPAWLKLIL